MKTRIPVYTACILIIITVQSTLADYIMINNVKPNLLIIFIISVALLRGIFEGGIVGFIAGLVQDILFGKVMGFYTLLGLYLGVTVGSLNKRLYRDNHLVVIFFTFVSTFVYEFFVYLFITLMPLALSSQKITLEILKPLKSIVLNETIYNSAICIPIYILVTRVDYWLENLHKASRKY
jgi:rod shape-determining protein MreD